MYLIANANVAPKGKIAGVGAGGRVKPERERGDG